MGVRTIPLSQLKSDLVERLIQCAESGETLVVELPGQRLVAIQPLDPQEDDDLIDRLLETNPGFRALVAKSKTSSRGGFGSSEQ